MKQVEQDTLWEPSAVLEQKPQPESEDARVRALLAERANWIRSVGRRGWQRELNRRRAARIARHRDRRTS